MNDNELLAQFSIAALPAVMREISETGAVNIPSDATFAEYAAEEAFDVAEAMLNEFRKRAKNFKPRLLAVKQVASGAGFGFCNCGWKSKVADDGGDYQWSDIQRDFDLHICTTPPAPLA